MLVSHSAKYQPKQPQIRSLVRLYRQFSYTRFKLLPDSPRTPKLIHLIRL